MMLSFNGTREVMYCQSCLSVGSKVGYRIHKTNKFDVDIVSDRDARSYTILTENGLQINRNHIDLKCTDVPFKPKTQPVVSSNANSKHAPANVPNSNVKYAGKAKHNEKRVAVNKPNSSTSMYKTHSGHISKPTSRLITQM